MVIARSHPDHLPPAVAAGPDSAAADEGAARGANAIEDDRILRVGENCWVRKHSDRVAYLIDGKDYFLALRSALLKAEQSIFIIGWELHSRVPLDPEQPPDERLPDGMPNRLVDLIAALVERRQRLRVYMLVWDFAMIYALEREIRPLFRLPWNVMPRVRFRYDDRHPLGASQHQKIVVIDDRIAFCGGIDVTSGRWDTPEHRGGDEHRRIPDGELYGPFHDVQMAVDGDAAAALGELARRRWHRVTGRSPKAARKANDPWPDSLQPDLTNVEVAIARTEPPFEGRPATREVERLFLDSIASAKEALYLENQYFTSAAVGNAIAESLGRDSGPDIVVVTSINAGGWLEESSMGVGRARLLRRLRQADKHGRLAAYHPVLPNAAPQKELKIHSKVMVVDDRLARIGSANLANRSMGLDSECDLAVEADGRPDLSEAISNLRDRLLAEHLGCQPQEVANAVASQGSLIAAIESLRGGDRSLEPINDNLSVLMDQIAPETEWLDPEAPSDINDLTESLLHDEDGSDAASVNSGPALSRKRLIGIGCALVAVVALAAAWKFSPLSELASVDDALGWAMTWRDSQAAPLLILAAFLIGGLVIFPVTVLISVTGILFGAFWGFVYALIGSALSALLLFLIGRILGRNTVRRLGGRFVNKISRRMAQRGILTVALLRLIPVAPFSVVNLVAGATHIRLIDFLLGTLAGMFPGTLALAVFGDQLIGLLREPSMVGAAVFAAALLLVIAATYGIQVWLTRGRGRAAEWSRSKQ